MRSHSRTFALAALAILATAPAVRAQANAPANAPANATGLRKELIQSLDDAQSKFIALANAMPQEKYSWRPGPGVRSVSEVFVHIASSNLFFANMAGVKRDPGVQVTRDMEKTMTDKAQIVEFLRKSFDFAKQAVMDVPDAEMEKAVNMFGTPSTNRGVLVTMATHAHEHLGQSIAYARMNGVVPPWSA